MADWTGKDRLRMTIDEARALGEAAMRGAGFDDGDAHILTDHVLDAALCGYEYSGLPKLLNVVDYPSFRQPRHPVSVVRETGATALLDGGNTTGMIAAYRASEATIQRAQAHGLAVVYLGNTWMTGRSAYYCEMIARAGLIVIHTVASPPAVAPFGGTRPALGTNPIAFGFPTDSDPLVIDMGTSAFMGTDLQFRARLGTPIPAGVALGPDGQPTTDAIAAQEGALLPFGGPEGGYKGFGLAVAMDALGALTAGIRSADEVSGYMFFAFKPDLFLSPGAYGRKSAEGSARSRIHRDRLGLKRSAFRESADTRHAHVLSARDRDRSENSRRAGTPCRRTPRSRRLKATPTGGIVYHRPTKASCHDDS
jgi:LDH2 family malate/lactate/ureidoglycolate dehydrogenase